MLPGPSGIRRGKRIRAHGQELGHLVIKRVDIGVLLDELLLEKLLSLLRSHEIRLQRLSPGLVCSGSLFVAYSDWFQFRYMVLQPLDLSRLVHVLEVCVKGVSSSTLLSRYDLSYFLVVVIFRTLKLVLEMFRYELAKCIDSRVMKPQKACDFVLFGV